MERDNRRLWGRQVLRAMVLLAGTALGQGCSSGGSTSRDASPRDAGKDLSTDNGNAATGGMGSGGQGTGGAATGGAGTGGMGTGGTGIGSTGGSGIGSGGMNGGRGGGGSSAGGMSGTGGVGAAGGTASGGASAANTGGAGGATLLIVPDAGGYVGSDTNSVGLQGAWYVFGDNLGGNGMPPGICQQAGHADAECSMVASPSERFSNVGGRMCTSGTAAKVIEKVGMPGMPDYNNIDGAGIGLDWNNPGGPSAKGVFNADAKGVRGISFDLDMKPLAGMRVEFPTVDTAGIEAGPHYWGATPAYPPSPVQAGTNTLFWKDVTGPKGGLLNPSLLYGVRFHVPSTTSQASPYSFCISNFKLLL